MRRKKRRLRGALCAVAPHRDAELLGLIGEVGGDAGAGEGDQTGEPHDPGTGEEIEKREVVTGYEHSRGEFVTFTAEELKALDVESSKVIDLEKFAPRNDIDPVY